MNKDASLYDELGAGFALLRSDSREDTSGFLQAAKALGLPLKVVDIDPPAEVADHYSYPLVLVRPDQHVAWRGSSTGTDPVQTLAKVTGR
jgi:hypothetical protein